MKEARSAALPKRRPVRVVIAEDHILLRELIIRLVSETAHHFRFIAEVGSLGAAMQDCIDLEPDLLILSLGLATREGHGGIAGLRTRVPNINVLVYGNSLVSERDVAMAVRTGVNGCVGKRTSIAE